MRSGEIKRVFAQYYKVYICSAQNHKWALPISLRTCGEFSGIFSGLFYIPTSFTAGLVSVTAIE